MKVNFISINPVTNIPSLRFFVNYFIEKKAIIEITEVHVKSFNTYYNNLPEVEFDNIAVYKNHQLYSKNRSELKNKKYLILLRKLVSCFF